MFMAPYVFSGPSAAAMRELPNDAARLLVHLMVDLSADRTHPYWSVRPLSLSHLRRLWPGLRPPGVSAPQDRARALRGAVESELRSRVEQALPDVPFGASQHEHNASIQREGNCPSCAPFLNAEGVQLPEIREDVLNAVVADDGAAVLRLVPSLLSEMIAGGWTTSFVHRLANGFLLDPQKKHADKPFQERLRDGLWPTPALAGAERRATLIRKLVYDKPGSFSFPAEGPDIDGISLLTTPGDIFLQLRQVPDTMSKIVQAADDLDAAAETWAGYFRLAVPAHSVFVADTFKVDSEGILSGLRRPEHRRFWSIEDSGVNLAKLISSRRLLSPSDAERLDASIAWAGLAVGLWEEAPIRSLALLWMAMETLYGSPGDVYELGPLAYLKRLPLELGYDVARHVNRRRAVEKADWISKVITPPRVPVSQFVRNLVQVLAEAPFEILLHHRADQVADLFAPAGRTAAAERVRRELQFLYSIRNAMAHTGRTAPLGPVTLYLMNTGMEVLKATIAELIATAEKTEGAISLDKIIELGGASVGRDGA